MGEGFIFTEEVWIERTLKNEFKSLLFKLYILNIVFIFPMLVLSASYFLTAGGIKYI